MTLTDEEVREALKASYYEGFNNFNDIDVKFEDVSSFIAELRQSDRQFLRERIEGMRLVEVKVLAGQDVSKTATQMFRATYNGALEDVLELLTPTNN